MLGTDISDKMLKTAKYRNPHPVIEYRCTAMEDMEMPDETFNTVMSSLAMHYIRDFILIVKKYTMP